MKTKHSKDCHLGDNYKECPACVENLELLNMEKPQSKQLHKGQVVWLGFNRKTIPPSWRGLKAAVVGPTRNQRYKLSIAPDQPHGTEICTLGADSILLSNPHINPTTR